MKRYLVLGGLAFAAAVSACTKDLTRPIVFPPDTVPTQSLDAQLRQQLRNWFVIPIGAMPQQNQALVELGQALMFDKILSGNRDVSCATCHEPALTVGDGQSLSIGTGGTGDAPSRSLGAGRQFVPRNAPTLVNAGLGLNYIFWDGRVNRIGLVGPPVPGGGGGGNGEFESPAGAKLPRGLPDVLAAQAMFPVTNRTEMRGNKGDLDRFGNPNELAQYEDTQFVEIWAAVMRRVLAIPDYVAKFNAAFPGVPTSMLGFQHAAIAIAAFEKQSLTRTNSPFDRYLVQENDAISTDAKRGALFFFTQAGCGSCHNGPFIGGNSFANVGVPQIGPGTGRGAPLDFGFGERINNDFYKFAFRVAPLRNVELSAPYTHSGAYPTLEAVVRHYNNVDSAQRNYDVSQIAPELRASYHGDATTIAAVLQNVDFRVRRNVRFTAEQQQQLVAFLKSLTDPAARDLSSIAPTSVPSGLPVKGN